jgi:membrane protease YdiL (CAAX protease family)
MEEADTNQRRGAPMGRAFVDLTLQGANDVWRYIVSLGLIGVFWIALGSIPLVAMIAIANHLGYSAPEDSTSSVPGLPPLAGYIGINWSLVILLVGTCLVVPIVHRRRLRTLVTTRRRFSWRRAAQGFGVFFILAAIDALIEWGLNPSGFEMNFKPMEFLVFVPFAIVLTPLQAAAEEVLVRGYLLQMFGRWLRSPLAGALFSAVLFAGLHFLNPEMESGYVAMALNYLAMGLFMGLIVLRDNRIELAIGAHAGSNFFLAVFMTYPNSALTTPAIFTTTHFNPVSSLIAFCVMAPIYWILQFHVLDKVIPPPDDDEAPPEDPQPRAMTDQEIITAEWVEWQATRDEDDGRSADDERPDGE